MQKRRDRPRDPDPPDRRGHRFGSERQTPAECEVNRGQRDPAGETFRSPKHVLIDLRPHAVAGAPPDAPTATPLVKPTATASGGEGFEPSGPVDPALRFSRPGSRAKQARRAEVAVRVE